MSSGNNLILLDKSEYGLRLRRLQHAVGAVADAVLVGGYANLYWLTGRVFSGFAYVPCNGSPLYGLRRCVHLGGDGVAPEHKIETFAERVAEACPPPARIAMEMDVVSYSAIERARAAFASRWPGIVVVSAAAAFRAVRAVKTPLQLRMMRASGLRQEVVYRRIPELYMPGMTDFRLQVEIERALRLEGCLGQFRVSGQDMEIFMGSMLTGDNADAPSPYDFALGGAGMDPSLPVGADGSPIRRGSTVMIDMNGNFTGYMTDMTRTFRLGDIPDEAMRAHELSRAVCRRLADMGAPGTPARDMYDEAFAMVREAGMEHCFMGHRQQAGFVGHGLGIEINEAPVIAPRSRDVLGEGMCMALEPKFVIPGVGAVGVENTYVVRADGPMECITNAPEEIINLEK